MKKAAELSLLTPSLKTARIVFLANLLLMVPVVSAEEARTKDPVSSITSSKSTEKKENRMLDKFTSLGKDLIGQAFLIDQAIKDIKADDIKKELETYKAKTDEHIKKLSKFIESQGGEAPQYSRDVATFFGQTWEQIRGLISTKGELTALRNQIENVLKEEEDTLYSADLPSPEKSKPLLQEIVNSTKELKNYLDKAIT